MESFAYSGFLCGSNPYDLALRGRSRNGLTRLDHRLYRPLSQFPVLRNAEIAYGFPLFGRAATRLAQAFGLRLELSRQVPSIYYRITLS